MRFRWTTVAFVEHTTSRKLLNNKNVSFCINNINCREISNCRDWLYEMFKADLPAKKKQCSMSNSKTLSRHQYFSLNGNSAIYENDLETLL